MNRVFGNIGILLAAAFGGPIAPAHSQQLSLEGKAPNVVQVGEQFRLTYEIGADPSSFEGPALDDFYVVGGPGKSTSTSIRIINGKRSSSYTVTYTYYIQARKEGKFTIPPAKATVKGKEVSSNSIDMEVVKGNAPSTQQSGKSSAGKAGNASVAVSNDQIYVRILTNRTRVYQGQHLVVTLKLYTRVQVSNLGKNEMPDFNGFWSQEIPQPQQISLQRENVNGVIYNTGVIRKLLLFPQHTGEITIDPFKLEAIVRQKVSSGQGGIFDDFFSNYRDVSKMLVSPAVKIDVLPLPAGKPASFKGAVGDFKMTTSIDKTGVKTNDAITLKFTVSGNGNLKLLDAPDIKFPPDFETYDPKITTDIKNTASGQSGSKTFEFLLIPRHAGTYRLPPLDFSYFDLGDKSYKSIHGKQYTINVAKGAEDQQIGIVQGLSKEEYQKLSTDILYIKTGRIPLYRKGNYLFGSLRFFAVYAASLVLFVLIVILRRSRIKRMQNVEMVRNRKANKVAGKRLKVAHACLRGGQKEEFYESVLKAFMGYLGDKLNIPVSDLTKDRAAETLNRYGIDGELVRRFMGVIDECEMARYSPLGDEDRMGQVFEDSVRVLSDLEKKLKK